MPPQTTALGTETVILNDVYTRLNVSTLLHAYRTLKHDTDFIL